MCGNIAYAHITFYLPVLSIMDVKLAFLTVAAAALSYHTEIGRDAADSYSAVACQKFPVRQQELYHFVTFPDIADKVS